MSARAWVAFASVSFLWGIPYLFIKIAVDDGIPPAFLAWSRVLLAAVILLGLSWHAGLLGTLRGRLRWMSVYALVEICVPFPLIAAGEQHVSSSLAAILIAAVPLIVALLAIRFDQGERAQGRRLVGLLVGFSGVIALVGLDVAGQTDELIGAGAILVAATGYAAGPMIMKRHLSDLEPIPMMGAALGIAALVLTPAALIAPPSETPPSEAIGALLILGLLCTATAFVFFAALINEVGPGRATVITYVAPVVAVALGVAVLGERPGTGAVAGLLLIIAGSWLSTDGRLPPGLAQLAERRSRRRRSIRPREEAGEALEALAPPVLVERAPLLRGEPVLRQGQLGRVAPGFER